MAMAGFTRSLRFAPDRTGNLQACAKLAQRCDHNAALAGERQCVV
jgi:hypothetical protein